MLKKSFNLIKTLLIQAGLVIALLLGIDWIITRFDLVPLPLKPAGHSVYGFGTTPVEIGSGDSLVILFMGDSHSEYRDTSNQAYVLHRYLESRGIPNKVIAYAKARYNPVQAKVVYDNWLKEKYRPDIFIYLLYGGNDFAEIIRNDDRPRVDFDAQGKPFIAPPRWFMERPADTGWKFNHWPTDSRIIYLLNGIVRRDNIVLKLRVSRKSIELLNPGIPGYLEYVWNLYRFRDTRLGYPGGIAAQYLNQYYLMTKYPEAFRRESLKRMAYFMHQINRDDPGTDAYCFFLPSAPAIDALCAENQKIERDIRSRSRLSAMDIPALERELIGSLKGIAEKAPGQLTFHDLSPALASANRADGTQTFYDQPSVHIDVKARKVVGEAMGEKIIADLINKD
jgi:hypothetical protein